MIKAIIIVNNHGKPRLTKFYTETNEDQQQSIVRRIFQQVSGLAAVQPCVAE